MRDAEERVKDITHLLKQISSGLSAYRLYPGNLEQSSFVSAVSRVRAAADQALIGGTVVVEVHGDEFHTGEGPLAQDDSLKRLASACYDRRGDMLRVRAVPEAGELATFYEILTMTPEELVEQGGATKLLEAQGVTSFMLNQVELLPLDARIAAGLNAEQAELWERLQHGQEIIFDAHGGTIDMAGNGTGGGGYGGGVGGGYGDGGGSGSGSGYGPGSGNGPGGDGPGGGGSGYGPGGGGAGRGGAGGGGTPGGPGTDLLSGSVNPMDDESALNLAESIYGRFQGLVHALPSEVTENPDLYNKLRRAVGTLPEKTRHALSSILLKNVTAEPLAARMIGTMTDADLARTLADMGRVAEEDPVGLAERLVSAGLRRDDNLIELTKATAEGQNETGTIMPAAKTISLPPHLLKEQQPLGQTVSDLLGQELLEQEHDDIRAVRDEFPTSQEGYFNIAMATFEDYLGLEEDVDRLEQVLDIWSQETRSKLLTDGNLAERLVSAANRAGVRASQRVPDVESLFKTYRRRVLDSALLREIIKPGKGHEGVETLLAPFGESAVEALLDLLAVEEDRGRRAALITILTNMADEHWQMIAERLDDARWYVVRNLIIILSRSNVGKEITEYLEKATRHSNPAVRQEAIRGVVPRAKTDSMPHLRRMLNDADESVRTTVVNILGGFSTEAAVAALSHVVRAGKDVPLKKKALDELGRSPAPGALRALEQLASFRSQPRLPFKLRRYAKSLAKLRGGKSG